MRNFWVGWVSCGVTLKNILDNEGAVPWNWKQCLRSFLVRLFWNVYVGPCSVCSNGSRSGDKRLHRLESSSIHMKGTTDMWSGEGENPRCDDVRGSQLFVHDSHAIPKETVKWL